MYFFKKLDALDYNYSTGSVLVPSGSAEILPWFDCSNRAKVDYYNDPRSYPLCCWLPFEIVDDWIFYAMFVWHSTALMIVVLVYLGIDSYFFGSIYAVGGQIEMLNSSLSNVQCSITEGTCLLPTEMLKTS